MSLVALFETILSEAPGAEVERATHSGDVITMLTSDVQLVWRAVEAKLALLGIVAPAER